MNGSQSRDSSPHSIDEADGFIKKRFRRSANLDETDADGVAGSKVKQKTRSGSGPLRLGLFGKTVPQASSKYLKVASSSVEWRRV
jgi:hypothetical protein